MSTTHSFSNETSSNDGDVQWGIHVELGPCRVIKGTGGKFTTYTFHFKIANEVHEFSSRYSKLYHFHQSLSKSEVFQKAFNYDPPKFPPKYLFKDFTKPKNYRQRGKQLLLWFRFLLSKPLILRDKIFQKGIHLQKELQIKMSQIAIDLQSRKRVINLYANHNHNHNHNHHHNNNHNHNNHHIKKTQIIHNKPIIKQPNNNNNDKDDDDEEDNNHQEDEIQEFDLSLLLNKIKQETENEFIFCDDNLFQETILNETNYDFDKINELEIFSIYDILPSHLLLTNTKNNDNDNDNYNKNTFEINKRLLSILNEKENGENNKLNNIDNKLIDDISFDIRDQILLNCEIST